MSLDTYSPCVPARVKVTVVPVGPIKQSRFAKFFRRLQRENVVRLGDVSPDGRPDRTMFSPLAFPDGVVHYDLSQSLQPSAHLDLVPFEAYRLSCMVVGILDWKEVQRPNNTADEEDETSGYSVMLSQSLDKLKENFSTALAQRLMVFDCEESIFRLPKDVDLVPPRAKSRTTTMKTVMCDLTASFLAELSVYGKSLQEKPTLEAPRAPASSMSSAAFSSLPAHMVHSPRPMSMAVGSGPSSPMIDEKFSNRMSMPPQAIPNPDTENSTSSPGLDFSSHDPRSPPFRSEESLPVDTAFSPKKPSLERTGRSLDPHSTPSLGSGNVAERERSKGKARIGIVVGSLYLLSGQWPDAIRELSRGATTARANSDYIWQAKAIDYLIVCLITCAWAGMDFKIPDVLRPASELLQTSSTKASKHSSSGSQHDISLSKPEDPEKSAATVKAFAKLLPDLIYNVLNLYGRAYTFTDDKIPSPSFETTAIRSAKLLAALRFANGNLDQDILQHLVANAPIAHSNDPSFEFFALGRPEIVQILLRAYPSDPGHSSLSVSDRLSILAAIASVLTDLAQYRKAVIILRDIISSVLPSLVQARKDDAAEMGIHPAASLAALNGSVTAIATNDRTSPIDAPEEGMRSFLNLVCKLLGISNPRSPPQKTGDQPMQDSDAAVMAMRQAIFKTYGAQDLKIDVLWACINICEALPDLAGALHYSAILLNLTSSGIAPTRDSTDAAAVIPVEEQERLANNINRTLGAAQHLGLGDLHAEYWDDFLVRGVQLAEDQNTGPLVPHAKSDLNPSKTINGNETRDPFIHNPFLEPRTSTKENVLVLGEQATFRVNLQNLFDFELIIDSISLVCDANQAECLPEAVLLGPYRTQVISLCITPHTRGKMSVRGCYATIRGCRGRFFSIYSDHWNLPPDVKGRSLESLSVGDSSSQAASEEQLSKKKRTRSLKAPKASLVTMKVIDSQPMLEIKEMSLSQSTLMLLDGESQTFGVTLHNRHLTTPADLVLVSFRDSRTDHIQESLSNKELSASELHDFELELMSKKVLQLHQGQASSLSVDAFGELSLEIEAFGKPDLDEGHIQLDYGFLGAIEINVQDQFYTRQVSIPLKLTVNPTITLRECHISRLDDSPSYQARDTDGNEFISPAEDTDNQSLSEFSGPKCIILFDFKNDWISALTLCIHSVTRPDRTLKSKILSQHQIQPGSLARVPVLVPRVYLPPSKCQSPIPILNPATKRQFVVSAAPSSAAAELEAREAFWFRESMLSHLSASWTEESTGRTGTVDLRRHMVLTPEMVAAYRLDDIEITMSVEPCLQPANDQDDALLHSVKRLSEHEYEVPTSQFLNIRTRLLNRSTDNIRPLLRLQPSQAYQAPEVGLDLYRKLLVHGLTQRVLPEIRGGEEQIADTGFVVLSKGTYSWRASVEEVVKGNTNGASNRGEPQANGSSKSRPRARTGEFDISVEDTSRRTWVAERECLVIARDVEDDAGN